MCNNIQWGVWSVVSLFSKSMIVTHTEMASSAMRGVCDAVKNEEVYASLITYSLLWFILIQRIRMVGMDYAKLLNSKIKIMNIVLFIIKPIMSTEFTGKIMNSSVN